MRHLLASLLMTMVVVCPALATAIENAYFALNLPDDSWAVTSDGDALGRLGARAMISRSDAARVAIDLARIDYLDIPFTPDSYLRTQVLGRRDIFCKNATDMGAVGDTLMLGRQAKRVHFIKQSNGYTYQCTAWAATVGFGTLFVIEGRREGQPNVVGRVVSGLQFRCDTTTLQGMPQLVAAARRTLKRHPLVSTGINEMKSVAMPDSATLEFTVVAPYLRRDAVDVPLFVQAKRDEWMKAQQAATLTDLLLATAMTRRLQLRYVFIDDRGHEIGTLLILPEEYEALRPK